MEVESPLLKPRWSSTKICCWLKYLHRTQ